MLRANPIARTASPIAMIVHTLIRLLRPDLANLRSSALRFLLVLIAVTVGVRTLHTRPSRRDGA